MIPDASSRTTADPLITRPIAVNILLALYETAERVVADARAITIPTQLLISGADCVVHHGPQHRFFERLGTPIKERHVLPGFSTTRSARRTVPRRSTRRARSSSTRFAEALEPADHCSKPTASAIRATKRTRWPRRCRCSRRAGLFWALRG